MRYRYEGTLAIVPRCHPLIPPGGLPPRCGVDDTLLEELGRSRLGLGEELIEDHEIVCLTRDGDVLYVYAVIL